MTPEREKQLAAHERERLDRLDLERREERARIERCEQRAREEQDKATTLRAALKELGATDREIANILIDRSDRFYLNVDETPAQTLTCEREKQAAARVEAIERRRAHYAEQIPLKHLISIYDNTPIEDDALAAAREFLASDDLFLVLSGGLGTRKTGAACWALTQLPYGDNKHGGWGFDRNAPRCPSWQFIGADEFSRSFGFDKEAEKLADELRDVDWLVFDDLGTEYIDKNGWFVQHFNSLMNHRYGAMKRTILTTNLTDEKFKTQYPRILDRILETGEFVLIGGKSKRQKKPQSTKPLSVIPGGKKS